MATPSVIISYASGLDGFAAAWALRTKRGYRPSEPVHYRVGNAEESMPDFTQKIVYILGYTYPLKTVLELASRTKFLCIIDNHQSSLDELNTLPDWIPEDRTETWRRGETSFSYRCASAFVLIDTKKSTAELTWEFSGARAPRPWFFDHIERAEEREDGDSESGLTKAFREMIAEDRLTMETLDRYHMGTQTILLCWVSERRR